MADPLWSRISDLVARALELPAAERAAFLAREAGDDSVREEAASLVEAAVSGAGFLDRLGDRIRRPALSATAAAPEPSRVGRRVGPWRLVEPLGRGGMGTVYLAERADGAFDQRVALKLLRAPLLGSEGRNRFTAERQILARLEHPAIARLLDGGILPDGVPWFAMEYVEGVPITDACEARDLGIGERLELFLAVCDAVDYAHRSLVVHRDLKPGNVLVTADGEVKLLDFGVAQLLAPDESASADRHPVTPAYAAPEQLRGEATTTATDVWALGVLLYELLTGRRPHDEVIRDEATGTATYGPLTVPSERMTRDDGEVLSAREPAARRAARPRRLHGRVAGDMDAIVCKALEPNPLRRYRGAAELADDVRRHQDRRPVRAREPALGYQLRCFVGRHRLEVAAVAIIAFLLLAVAGLAVHSALRASADRQRLAQERGKAEAVSEFLLGVFTVADPEEAPGETVSARELLDRGARRVREDLADQPEVQASMLHTLGRAYRSLGLYERADRLLSRALELRRGGGRGSDPELAAILLELGRTRLGRDDAEGAEELLEEALVRLGEPAPVTAAERAATLSTLAAARSARNDFAGAETALRRTLALQRRLGLEAKTADTLFALGEALHFTGDFDQAWQRIQEAVEVYRRVGRTDSPEYANALLSLAAVHHTPRGGTEAIELTEEALALRRRIYAPDHPLVSEALIAAGRAAADAGRWAAAERHLRQAVRLERRRTPVSEGLARALTHLARVLRDRTRPTEALGLLEEAVALGARRPRSTTHVTALDGLGDALRAAGRLDAAERRYRERLGLCQEMFGRDHPMAIRAEADLAGVALDRHDFAAAEASLRRALVIYREILRREHPRIAELELDLGHALFGLGRDAEAEPLVRHAATVLAEAYGADDRRARRARILLDSGVDAVSPESPEEVESRG